LILSMAAHHQRFCVPRTWIGTTPAGYGSGPARKAFRDSRCASILASGQDMSQKTQGPHVQCRWVDGAVRAIEPPAGRRPALYVRAGLAADGIQRVGGSWRRSTAAIKSAPIEIAAK
jgi:hypothetical protein